MSKEEILLGAGELFLCEFKGNSLPELAEIETEDNNVGHCSGGFTVDYKPTKYDISNQYDTVVRSFITKEAITAKTGILSWNIKNLTLLSTGEYSQDATKKVRTITFTGKGKALTTVLLRFVHTKENGKKIRFTMIGQGGSGFAMDFASKELVVDAEIAAISILDGFLASFEEELTDKEVAEITPGVVNSKQKEV